MARGTERTSRSASWPAGQSASQLACQPAGLPVSRPASQPDSQPARRAGCSVAGQLVGPGLTTRERGRNPPLYTAMFVLDNIPNFLFPGRLHCSLVTSMTVVLWRVLRGEKTNIYKYICNLVTGCIRPCFMCQQCSINGLQYM